LGIVSSQDDDAIDIEDQQTGVFSSKDDDVMDVDTHQSVVMEKDWFSLDQCQFNQEFDCSSSDPVQPVTGREQVIANQVQPATDHQRQEEQATVNSQSRVHKFKVLLPRNLPIIRTKQELNGTMETKTKTSPRRAYIVVLPRLTRADRILGMW